MTSHDVVGCGARTLKKSHRRIPTPTAQMSCAYRMGQPPPANDHLLTNNVKFHFKFMDRSERDLELPDVLTMPANHLNSVHTVKKRIETATHVPVEAQRLVFAGKQLQDHKSIATYNVQRESTFYVIVMPFSTGDLVKPASR
jgi:Ubiquitin family